jgi:peptide/nickel transport system substrate-binding protein
MCNVSPYSLAQVATRFRVALNKRVSTLGIVLPLAPLCTGGKLKISRLTALGAVVGAAALVLAGCSAPQESEIVENTSLSVAQNASFVGYNTQTSNGNSTYNSNITYMTTSQFNYYDNTPKLIRNTKFGTYKKISDDPLTIKYTVNKDVKWSDGSKVDGADLLLSWAANISKFNTVKPKTDADGNITNQDEIDKGVFFDSVNAGGGLDQVEATPKISDDGQSLTLVYAKPFVDWEVNFTVGVPAHVTYDLAFPDKKLSATKAKAAVIKAIQDNDTSVLGPLSKAWTSGYDQPSMPSNKAVFLSDGAYTITNLVKDQYVTLTANKKFTWGPLPKVQKITVRFIQDPLAQVQALQNGEVGIINGQPTADTLSALAAVKTATTKSANSASYEHVDLTFNNKGPFDPASYGGDAAKALAVRQAFLKIIPRQEIVDKLIKPLNPSAGLVDSQTLLPGYAGYDDMIKANGSSAYDTVDVAGAKALLKQAGVTTPVKVNFMYGKSNTRRANEYQLIEASGKLAGFDVVDAGNDDWPSKLGDGTYDAVLFAWQSTSLAVTATMAQWQAGAGNNLNGYSNDAVNAAATELNGTYDKAKQLTLLQDIEKNLWADAYGVTIFQFPDVIAFNKKIKNVSDAPLSPTVFWNYYDWTVPAKAK